MEESPYEFFKGITDSTSERVALFKENPELVEQFTQEGQEARTIIEAIEKTSEFSSYKRAKNFQNN